MTDVATVVERLKERSVRRTDGVVEEVTMVERDGRHLMSVSVQPEQGARTTGLVIAHSFLEMAMLQKTELTLARKAAAAGFPVLYLQAPGAGDSEGAEEELNIEARVTTALAAGRHLRESAGVEGLLYFGARLGAAVAVLAAARTDDLAGLALWDPIFDAERYWKQARRLARVIAVVGRQRGFEDPDKELARSGWASMFGNTITSDLKADLKNIESALEAPPLDAPGFLLSLNDDMVAKSRASLEPIVARLETHSLGRGDVGHLGLRDAPEAVAPTVEWMERTLT